MKSNVVFGEIMSGRNKVGEYAWNIKCGYIAYRFGDGKAGRAECSLEHFAKVMLANFTVTKARAMVEY